LTGIKFIIDKKEARYIIPFVSLPDRVSRAGFCLKYERPLPGGRGLSFSQKGEGGIVRGMPKRCLRKRGSQGGTAAEYWKGGIARGDHQGLLSKVGC
jgi:hypothetical protein